MRFFIHISFILIFTISQIQVFAGPSLANLQSAPAPAASTPTFVPLHLKGVRIDPQTPLKMEFFVDPGTESWHTQNPDYQKNTIARLIRYFLAGLTIPEDLMWVNLSPHEPERIIPAAFAKTEMGRDVLAQDLVLKHLTADTLNIEHRLGQAFWNSFYSSIDDESGNTDLALELFSRIWIVPEQARVYADEHMGIIVNASFDVMLEDDYKPASFVGKNKSRLREKAYQQLRQDILPRIKDEVNHGQSFQRLRQIYSALLLATWYKKSYPNSLLGKRYSNQSIVRGIDFSGQDDTQRIYHDYLKAFQQGTEGTIHQQYDPTQQIITHQHYTTGGTNFLGLLGSNYQTTNDFQEVELPSGTVSAQVDYGTDNSGHAS